MKKLEFTTGKGRFVIVDCDEHGKVLHPSEENIEIGRLNKITEEQASEIVDHTNFIGFAVYEDYQDSNKVLYKAIDSLHSLIKSNGWYLENPEGVSYLKMNDAEMDYRSFLRCHDAKSRTLHNPVVFKIN